MILMTKTTKNVFWTTNRKMKLYKRLNRNKKQKTTPHLSKVTIKKKRQKTSTTLAVGQITQHNKTYSK